MNYTINFVQGMLTRHGFTPDMLTFAEFAEGEWAVCATIADKPVVVLGSDEMFVVYNRETLPALAAWASKQLEEQ
jgi:hypothetical protein